MKNQNLFQATTTALNGLRVLAREKAFWREIGLLLVATALLFVKPSVLSAALVIVAILMIAVEALNTAIEHLCDLIQPERDQRIKEIKDVAAAAIFVLTLLYIGLLLTYLANWL
jgi:diacylglycerol kinase (ATP)